MRPNELTGNPPVLSFNQDFLCSLDHGETAGALSQWYTITYGLRLTGKLDVGALSAALDDVVARHEMLRTTLRKDAGGWHQYLNSPGQVDLRLQDVGAADTADRAAYDLLDEVEAEPLRYQEMPLLRAVLGRLGADDQVLALTTHHIASDAWSMQVIITDLAACYAARAAGRTPSLPAARQHREFAQWQRTREESWSGVASGHWRERLLGARVHTLPADRVLADGAADPYSVYRFVISRELAQAAGVLARSTRTSLFVALLAAYNLLASQLTGEADLVVPTFTAGRAEPRFAGVVGPLYNFLPIRTDLRGCGSFTDVIARTRASCLDAFAHDIPFTLIQAQAAELMRPCGDDHLAVCAFEMLPPPALAGIERAGDLRYSELRGRRTSRPVGAGTPKGMLWALDHLRSGELLGLIRFSRDRFDQATIAGIATKYCQLLATLVAEPAAQLVRS
jgi:condensation enzyme